MPVEHGTLRARVLVVPDAVGSVVVETELRQDRLQVSDLLRARKLVTATSADSSRAFGVGPLVVRDAKVPGPLEDVEQLPERDVPQPKDHRQRMQRVQRRIETPLEPDTRHREEQPGDRHREQPGQGEEVTATFGGQGSRVT